MRTPHRSGHGIGSPVRRSEVVSVTRAPQQGQPNIAVEQPARAWVDAAARRDVKALDRVLAADFSMVTNRESLIVLAQWMDNTVHRVGRDFTPPESLDVRGLVVGTS